MHQHSAEMNYMDHFALKKMINYEYSFFYVKTNL